MMKREVIPADVMERFRSLHLYGDTPLFLEALKKIVKISSHDTNVLIEGETGTGKELAARAIHALGRRRDRPFVPVNCGALPDTLVESELFGHTRGAFTDAKEARPGVIGHALGGTLFLDEIDSLSLRSQVVLLRFLQDREYRPIGGMPVVGADIRVVCASNADLSGAVNQGLFRQDLLFRLNVLTIRMPPLRERRDDILPLAKAFLDRFALQYRRPSVQIDPESVRSLNDYGWPGNVRELENVLLREFLLTDTAVIRLPPLCGRSHHEPLDGTLNSDQRAVHEIFRVARLRAIAEFERTYLTVLLTRTKGNISSAARLSGTERSALTKLVKKHGLRREDFGNC